MCLVYKEWHGQFVLPFLGAYNATKHAVEGLAENYRVELSQFGIQSLIVQPGGFGTDFGANLLRSSDTQVTQSYGELADAPEQMWAGTEQGHDAEDAPSPQMVADRDTSFATNAFSWASI